MPSCWHGRVFNSFTNVVCSVVLCAEEKFWFYTHRIAGGDCDYRDPCRIAFACAQSGLAAIIYSHENNDALLRSQHNGTSWLAQLRPLIGTNLYRCPSDPNKTRLFSYAINDFLLPPEPGIVTADYSKVTSLPSPTETFYLAEPAKDYAEDADHFHFADPYEGDYSSTGFSGSVDVRRHNGAANYLFVDGHVEPRSWNSLRPKLTQAGSRFVNPIGKP